MELVWYDMETGEAHDTPTLLAAYAWLIEHKDTSSGEYSDEDQAEIVELLKAAARAAHREPVLEHLADHIAAVRSDSERFSRHIQMANEIVPRYFRGEYGAKLALVDPLSKGNPWLGHPEDEEAMRLYREGGEAMSEKTKKALVDRIHPRLRNPTLQCNDCHKDRGALVDLEAVGYLKERITDLNHLLIIRMIDNIRKGKEFHLTGVLGKTGQKEPFEDIDTDETRGGLTSFF